MNDLNKLTLPRFAPLVATVRSNRYRVTPVVDDTNYAWTFDEARIGYGREEITAPDYYKHSQADALIERMLKVAPASAWMNDPRNPPTEPLTHEVYTHEIDWTAMFSRVAYVAFIAAIAVAVFVIVATKIDWSNFNQPYTCPRKHNGYPLASFKVQHNGAEYDCRYGTEGIEQ